MSEKDTPDMSECLHVSYYPLNGMKRGNLVFLDKSGL